MIGGLGLCGLLDHSNVLSLIATAQEKQGTSQPSSDAVPLSQDDDQFLDELEKRNFQFFVGNNPVRRPD